MWVHIPYTIHRSIWILSVSKAGSFWRCPKKRAVCPSKTFDRVKLPLKSDGSKGHKLENFKCLPRNILVKQHLEITFQKTWKNAMYFAVGFTSNKKSNPVGPAVSPDVTESVFLRNFQAVNYPMTDPWDDCIFTYILPLKKQPNVGKLYQSHGSYGYFHRK